VRKRTADNHSNLLDTFGNRRTMTPFDTKLVFGIESYVRIAPEAVGPEHACRENRIDQSALKSFARDERRGGRDGGGSRMPARPVDRCQRPWNKGLLVGQKKPLEPKHVWSIRVRLEIARSMRDLAIFNLAIDSKLRACDLVKLRLDDICSGTNVRRRATIVQKKTGRPVQFEISEQSRNSVEAWLPTLRATGSRYLFPTRIHASPHISIRQYARLVHRWIKSIGLESASYGTHSMRRTKAAQIYRKTGNLRAVQLLLGHTKLESTVRYLGIEVDDALNMAEQIEL
jgi:hypothetical protein